MPRRLRIERRIDLVLVALLCLAMAGCLLQTRPAPKPETKRVVYLGIKNGTPAMEQTVADRVNPGYERVSAEEYRETARKLNAEGLIDLDVARVAQALDIDVIIHGEYVRKNKRRGQLTVTMRTAAIGAVVGEYVIPVRRGAITKRGARQLDSELRAELEVLLGPPDPAAPGSAVASAEETPDQPAPAPADTGEKPADAEAAPAPAAQKAARAEPAPAPAAQKATRAEAAPSPAAQKATRAEAAPSPAAQKATRGAKATGQPPGASGEPVKGRPDAAQNQPEPKAPAPVLQQDESGQVVDDERPPAPK
jgi:hypothetical protein